MKQEIELIKKYVRVGYERRISKEQLMTKIWGNLKSLNKYELYTYDRRLSLALRYLRRNTDYFTVPVMEQGIIYYYIPTNMKDTVYYFNRLKATTNGCIYMRNKCERFIKNNVWRNTI